MWQYDFFTGRGRSMHIHHMTSALQAYWAITEWFLSCAPAGAATSMPAVVAAVLCADIRYTGHAHMKAVGERHVILGP
eukprot:scaffold153400_cov16-Prasinocladus_malaysianus.AAC.1